MEEKTQAHSLHSSPGRKLLVMLFLLLINLSICLLSSKKIIFWERGEVEIFKHNFFPQKIPWKVLQWKGTGHVLEQLIQSGGAWGGQGTAVGREG